MDYCSHCGRGISEGKYWITNVGHKIHDACLRCAVCFKLIGGTGSYVKRGRYYCQTDFFKKWGIKCKVCSKYITKGAEYTILKGDSYHKTCLKCSNCYRLFYFGAKIFADPDNRIFCEKCTNNKFFGNENYPGSRMQEPETPPPAFSTIMHAFKTNDDDEENFRLTPAPPPPSTIKETKKTRTKWVSTVLAGIYDILL